MPEFEWRTQFSPRPASVHAARRAIGQTLDAWGRPELRDRTQLVTSELLTNAIVHGRGEPALRMHLTEGRLRVEVFDGTRQLPRPTSPPAEEDSGRGLRIVDALAECWGVEEAGHGKVVWAELWAPPAGT